MNLDGACCSLTQILVGIGVLVELVLKRLKL